MTHIRVTHDTTATPQDCWALMADFANIDFFNPHLSQSFLLEGSPQSGLGTTRQCDLKDGKNYIREKVVDWQEGRSYTVDIFDGTMPIQQVLTTLGLEPIPNGTRLYMETRYSPKFGLFGGIMDALFLRRMMQNMLQKVIEGLGEKAMLAESNRKVAV